MTRSKGELARIAEKVVTEEYEVQNASGRRWNLSETRAAALLRMSALYAGSGVDELIADTLADAVDAALSIVDRRRKRRPDDDLRLFDDELNDAVALGGGTRRRFGSLDLSDHLAHLTIVIDNDERTHARRIVTESRYNELLPYQRLGLSVEAARDAWRAAHPGQDLQ